MNQPKDSKEWQKQVSIPPAKLYISSEALDKLFPFIAVGAFLGIVLLLLIMYIMW